VCVTHRLSFILEPKGDIGFAVHDVKNTRHTRSARSGGSCSTFRLALAVPQWRGKRYERTPRSRLVVGRHRRAFSSFWAEGGLKRCPIPEGGVSMGRWYGQSSSLPFAPLRRGHVGGNRLGEKWRYWSERRNEGQGAYPGGDSGSGTGRTGRGRRRRVKRRDPERGWWRMCLRRSLVAIPLPGGDFQRH